MHDLYKNLFKQLNASTIRYCSWKNNHLLDHSLNGIGDIDLLVDINCLSEFESLLGSYGFVEFCAPRARTRCIRHYYSAQEHDDFILHIHVYYRIITGESQFKNYQFPFEQELLDNSHINDFGIAECNPHHQLQLYALRRLIKLSSLPSLMSALRDRKDSSDELEYLKSITQADAAAPTVDIGSSWVRKLESGKHSWFAGLSLRNSYRGYRLKTGLSAMIGSHLGILELVFRRVLRKKGKRCSGTVVAIVGLDGSGKSSSVDYLRDYYKTVLSVKNIHFGRPTPTLLTFPVKLAIDIYKKFKKPRHSVETVGSEKNSSLIQIIRLVALARDRYHAMCEANKFRAKGFLVLMDRCPVQTVGCMDAPKIIYSGQSRFMIWLRDLERSYYSKMPRVDHALFLKTSVESSIARNNARTKPGKETAEEITERYRVNANAVFTANTLHIIDTEHDLMTVRTEVKKCVWNILSSSN